MNIVGGATKRIDLVPTKLYNKENFSRGLLLKIPKFGDVKG